MLFPGSREISRAAVELAMTADREEEKEYREKMLARGIKCAAIDYGGDAFASVTKILERTVVAAKREGIISDSHHEEGAVAGAAHEAVTQIMNKAMGLNMGGKIGIAGSKSHIAVCVFFEVGLLNLNDVAIGLAHRAL